MLDDQELGISTSAEMARVDKLCAALDNKQQLIAKIKESTIGKYKTKKPIQIRKTGLADILAHTRNTPRSTNHYFTKGHKIKSLRNVLRERSPFEIPQDTFLSNMTLSKKRKRITGRKPHAYMSDYKTDIFARLFVPDDLTGIPPSKLDYNEEYFSLVRGRPIREHFDRHHFASNHRKCFFKKLCAGFLEDEIKRQGEHHIRDLWHMYNIREELDKVIQSFETYLAEDHQESADVIEESQQIANLKDQKVIELKRSSGYMNAIKCSLYKMEEDLSYRKYCKNAIYQISPTGWQEEFEKTKEAFKEQALEIAEEVYDHYQDFQLYTPEQDKFLDQLVADLISDIVNMGPPIIYFKHPWEVDLVFKEFEIQNLHAAKHLADVGKIQKNLKNLLKHVKDYYKKEFTCLQEKIQDLEAGIRYQKERSLELERIAKQLTNTVYRDVVSGDHILETHGLIQDLYFEILGDDDTKLSCTEMMELIEEEIADVWQQVQLIDRFKYEEYEAKVEAKTAQELSVATSAKRREREMVLTLQRLTRSYLPPHKQLWKRLNPRSDPPPMRRRFEKSTVQIPRKMKARGKSEEKAVAKEVKLPEKKEEIRRIKLGPYNKREKAPPRPGLRAKLIASEDSLIEGVFSKRFESESSEEEEEIKNVAEYTYDFTKLNKIHQNLLDRIKKYQLYGRDYVDEMMAEEGEEEFLDLSGQTFGRSPQHESPANFIVYRPGDVFRHKVESDMSVLPFGPEMSTQFGPSFEQKSQSRLSINKEIEDLISSFPKVPSDEEYASGETNSMATEAETYYCATFYDQDPNIQN